ncbi:MAG: LytTR family DNA-binding domain-containing protein [Bacteroidales bacterium]|nr:LytTR family DNA-binding domain-containing protein [Bacteroidales bacterium]
MENTFIAQTEKYSALCSKVKNRHISNIDREKIMYCEASRSYTWIYLVNEKKIKVSCRLNIVEKKLSSREFIRCHKSFLVNINHVIEISEHKPYTIKLENGLIIKVSENKVEDFLELIIQEL